MSDLGLDCGVDSDVGVDIQGCQPVSTDKCASGFMAPASNIVHPENTTIPQCCKCKPGFVCGYCKNTGECTEREEEDYVTYENCFNNSPFEPEDEEPPENTIAPDNMEAFKSVRDEEEDDAFASRQQANTTSGDADTAETEDVDTTEPEDAETDGVDKEDTEINIDTNTLYMIGGALILLLLIVLTRRS